MSPGPDTSDEVSRREPFRADWTGALAVGLFVYILIAILVTFLNRTGGPVFEIFNLFSDAPASIAAAVLAGVAARRATTPAVRRTWWYLTAAIVVYTLGNLLNSTYWLFGIDPFPSFGDVFFLGFYPLLFAAILNVIRAAAVRVQWGRLALDATILMLGFGAFFWFFVIAPTAAADRDPDVLKYVLTQSYIALNCLMLLAFGVLLMHAGAGPIHRRTLMLLTHRLLGDVSRRHRLGDVEGHGHLPPGRPVGRDLPVVLRLAHRRGARTAARRSGRRAGTPERLRQRADPGHALRRDAGVVPGARVRREQHAASPANSMTVIIFVLTLLVMLRQGVISRDDALLRERRAVGIVEARYASLIKNASDVIMIVDVDGRLRFASPAAERTFGIHPDDLVGRNLLDLWSEADRERLAALPRRGRRDARPHGRTVRSRRRHRRRGAARSSASAATCSTTRPSPASR